MSVEKSNGGTNDVVAVTPTNEATSERYSHQDDEEYIEPRMTKAKWLACIALGISYTTAFQQGATLGAIVKSIDEALGPTSYYNWMLSASTVSTSIALPLSGGFSDVFGRRWFVLIGCIIGVIAAIIAIVAKSDAVIIVASLIAGFQAGSQQLALAAAPELVPNKLRGRVQAFLDLSVLPWTVFGALMGGSMVTNYGKYGFRINFYIGLALNVVAFVLTYFWYHPPKRGKRLSHLTKRQALKHMDWIGVFLQTAGLVLFLVGITLGGTYPWTHPKTLGTLISGIGTLVLYGLWEWKGAKTPFLAHELFRGKLRTFCLFQVVQFVAGMGLYSAAAFWAQLVRGVWSGSPMNVGYLNLPGGFGIAAGGFLAGMTVGKWGFMNTRWCLVWGTIFKTVADYSLTLISPTGPHSKSFGMGMFFLSLFGTGWTGVALLVCVQLDCLDSDIGMATLVTGCIRAIGGSVAITVYSTILNKELTNHVGENVGKATVPLGLSLKAIPALVGLLVNEDYAGAQKIPGVTPAIYEAAKRAVEVTWARGFHNMYIVSASFSAASIIAAFLTKDVSKNMTNHVAVRLLNEKPRNAKVGSLEEAGTPPPVAAKEMETAHPADTKAVDTAPVTKEVE